MAENSLTDFTPCIVLQEVVLGQCSPDFDEGGVLMIN